MDKIDQFITENKDKWLKELGEYVAIPSISRSGVYGSQSIIEVANWLVEHFKKIGFKSELIKTPYDPLVFAEWKNPNNKFTLLIYSQADVQPADPVEEWETSPFKLTVSDGKIFARGISDSKGHLFAYIKSIESYLKVFGELPINIKFIIDCDEETDEVALPWFIKNNSEKLIADAVLIGAGNMVAPNTPSICYGYRGILAAELEVKTLKINLHSGTFGGGVLNATECLANILLNLRGEGNKISIPGFYDGVVSFVSEKPIYATAHYSEEDFLKVAGANKINRESEFSLDECLAARPTFDINGIYGGSSAEAFQYIIPAKA
ncbi:MAG: M20/M25/M40 family metallo-hydrolase, partial [Candidatus Paceibacterota bacterium]